MSETKWTPGPWMVSLTDDTDIIDAREEPVATTYLDYEDSYLCSEANARLIAAAPDLYEALRNCLEQCARNPRPDRGEHITQARAALAKAEGRDDG